MTHIRRQSISSATNITISLAVLGAVIAFAFKAGMIAKNLATKDDVAQVQEQVTALAKEFQEVRDAYFRGGRKVVVTP